MRERGCVRANLGKPGTRTRHPASSPSPGGQRGCGGSPALRGDRPVRPAQLRLCPGVLGLAAAEAPACGVGGACWGWRCQVFGGPSARRALPRPRHPHPYPCSHLWPCFPAREVSKPRTPSGPAPCDTFCEFANKVPQNRTRKEAFTSLNAQAAFGPRYLSSALCCFLVGLLCQAPFPSELDQNL